MRSQAWKRLNELDQSGIRFTRRVGNYCESCGQPVVSALQGRASNDYPIGLLLHAMHTNDGGEIIRVIQTLNENGCMQPITKPQ